MWYSIDTRDKPALLWAILRHFDGNARVSFEGNLVQFDLKQLPGATSDETGILCRHTIWPMQDFVSLPVSAETTTALKHLLSSPSIFSKNGPVVHVQVQSEEALVFGAYDNFAAGCVSAWPPTPRMLLDDLSNSGVIRSYTVEE